MIRIRIAFVLASLICTGHSIDVPSFTSSNPTDQLRSVLLNAFGIRSKRATEALAHHRVFDSTDSVSSKPSIHFECSASNPFINSELQQHLTADVSSALPKDRRVILKLGGLVKARVKKISTPQGRAALTTTASSMPMALKLRGGGLPESRPAWGGAAGAAGAAGIGGVLGFCTGKAAKVAAQGVAVGIGATTICLGVLNKLGYVTVNYRKMEQDLHKVLDFNKDGQVDHRDQALVSEKFVTFMSDNGFGSGVGFATGFYMGFKSL